MNPKRSIFRIIPNASQKYAAWNVAPRPKLNAINLCASSCTINAGAVTRQAKKNAFLSKPIGCFLNKSMKM